MSKISTASRCYWDNAVPVHTPGSCIRGGEQSNLLFLNQPTRSSQSAWHDGLMHKNGASHYSQCHGSTAEPVELRALNSTTCSETLIRPPITYVSPINRISIELFKLVDAATPPHPVRHEQVSAVLRHKQIKTSATVHVVLAQRSTAVVSHCKAQLN